MRTTMTLDDNIALTLKELAYRTGKSFKSTVDETLRAGLAALQKAPSAAKAYRLTTAALGGVEPGIDLDKALHLADALEDEGLARKLELRK